MISTPNPAEHERCDFCQVPEERKGRARWKGEESGKCSCDLHIADLLVAEHNATVEVLGEKLEHARSDIVTLEGQVNDLECRLEACEEREES